MHLILSALLALALGLAACGSTEPAPEAPAPAVAGGDDRPLIAAVGDSITAGSPLWDPDPEVRAAIGGALDERSQYGHWLPARVRFRNCGVFGERTDEIAERLEDCARGADALIVQGGINDIAQGRPVVDAADDLRSMVRAGRALGVRRIALSEVLPWNNGFPRAAGPIRELNGLIGEIGRSERVAVLPFFAALEGPADRMRPEWTDDGDHPSVEGYRRLGSVVANSAIVPPR